MDTNSKSKNIFTAIVLIIFIILSYAIVKSFFSDSKPKSLLGDDSNFSFVYDTKLLNDKTLNEMYDDTRTNKVVINKNYGKATDDVKKGKLFLNPNKFEFYFSNTDEEPKYYKLSIKNQDYLTIYKLNDSKNVVNFVILGSDLKYYKISISINRNTSEMDAQDKTWKEIGKKDLSIYTNAYYKVIDDICHIELYLPTLYNEEKYSEEVITELRDKLEKSISIEEVDNYEYNYYSFDLENINLDNKTKLLLKDAKVYQYFSIDDKTNKISYTSLTLIGDNQKLVNISDIDDIDKFNNYLDSEETRRNEYSYKGYNVNLLYNDKDVSKDGIIYSSILFDIDGHYYLITTLNNEKKVNDSNIDAFIDNYINGILEIN